MLGKARAGEDQGSMLWMAHLWIQIGFRDPQCSVSFPPCSALARKGCRHVLLLDISGLRTKEHQLGFVFTSWLVFTCLMQLRAVGNASRCSSMFKRSRDHAKMLRISSAASGEELLSLDAAHIDTLVQGYGSTVGSLKRHLAERHFQKRYSRFQLRFLREGAPDELQDDENIMPPMDLQLMLMNHLPPDEDRDRLFLDGCVEGQLSEVEDCLRGLQDPNVADDTGSALHWAVRQARLNIVPMLLEARADTEHVDSRGRRPLHYAAMQRGPYLAGLLLDAGAEIESRGLFARRPLHEAALHGHSDVVRLFCDKGAGLTHQDSLGHTAYELAFSKGREEISKLLHPGD